MINQEPQNPTTTKDHRRRGGAFDMLANFMKEIKELTFSSGFILRNRPGLGKLGSTSDGTVPVNSMVEAYFKQDSIEKINALIMGRKGDGEERNTHLIELSANHRPEKSALELGFNNGAVKLRATREGINPSVDRSGVTVADPNTLSSSVLPEGVSCQIVGQGEFGGVVLSHITNRGDIPTTQATGGRYILITDQAIRIVGLPTSSSGLPSGALWNSSGDLRIVP